MTVSPLWQGQETLVPSTLRGYRSWSVRDAKLHSTGVSHCWDGPEAHARCLVETGVGGTDPDCPCDLCARSSHHSPVADCTCGIYGWYDPEDARLVRSDVFGAVEVSGRTVLASHGFRAERARVVALAIENRGANPFAGMSLTLTFGSPFATPSDLHDIARWAKTQGIPVFATRAELIATFPPQDVSALVQHDCDVKCHAHAGYGGSNSLTIGTFLASGLATTTASSTYLRRNPKPHPGCRKRIHRAYASWFLVWFIAGLAMFALHPNLLTSIGPVLNGIGTTLWLRHLWTQHRTPRSERDAAEDDAEGFE